MHWDINVAVSGWKHNLDKQMRKKAWLFQLVEKKIAKTLILILYAILQLFIEEI